MASVPSGRRRADITEPAVDALRRYGNEDTHYYSNEYVLPLAERLVRRARGARRVDIALNGTEAVETSVRFMRRATGRPIVIGFMGGYHGEAGTAGAIGAETSDLSFGYRALMPGFVHVPYPNPYRTPFSRAPGGTGDGTIDYLRDHVLHHAVDPREVAGFVIEPVMGSGGCVAPPDGFWSALTELCREFDFLLCADEVKTGFGRTGHMFAVERWGVEPDLMALGKSMGGGVMPIGAVLGTERAMDFDDVSTGSTWSWLPAACAAALETLDVFEREPVLENVRVLEAAGLQALEADGSLPRHRRRARGRLLPGGGVREGPGDEGARPRAAGAGGVGMPAPWAAGGPHHDLAQPAALAHDAGRGHGHRDGDPRRGDRRSGRGVTSVSAEHVDDLAASAAARPRGARRDLVGLGRGARGGRPPGTPVRELGLPCRRMPVDGGADDLLIGWHERPSLLITAHMDTIRPTWEWSGEAAVRDGRVIGLGAQDDKACVVAALHGLLMAREAGVPLETLPVGIGLCVDEEIGGTGSIAMARTLRPPFVVGLEGTELQLGTAEAGFVEVWCHLPGVAVHGALRELGENAIDTAQR